jgi:hypothetical protein
MNLRATLSVPAAVALLLAAACAHQAVPGDAFALLAVPAAGTGVCERGPYRGGLFEAAPPGQTRIALVLGRPGAKTRNLSVVVDVAGARKLFFDELDYRTEAGVQVSEAIAVAFDSSGNIESGMQHLHELRNGQSSTDGDRELAKEKHAAVIATAEALLRRCAPEA